MRTAALFFTLALLATTSAPLDQYFGRLKMSALRIRYEIVSIRDRYETHKILPEEAAHLASLTQDAFDDWSRKYPNDQWLPSTAFLFAKLYAELPGAAARDQAVALYTLVKSRFPKTKYAADSRNALHHGVAVRPDPQWAAQRRAAAAATPSPAPSVSPSPASSSSPSPSISPAATPPRRAGPIRA